MSDINIGAISEALNNKVDLPTPIVSQDSVDYVIEMQQPTANNNYTWYRKYKSGWVEQGGTAASGSTSVTFPIQFADNMYYFNANLTGGGSGSTCHIVSSSYTTTGCSLKEGQYQTAQRALTNTAKWYACGMAA